MIRRHESGVEAHAELTDEFRSVHAGLALLLEEFQESPRSAFGDGPDVLDHLVLVHADAVVRDAEQLLILVGFDADRPLAHQLRTGQTLETRLVDGVGGVGYEFAQENVAV